MIESDLGPVIGSISPQRRAVKHAAQSVWHWDIVEVFKTCFIGFIGVVYVVAIGGAILGGIYLYAIWKSVT